MTGTERQEKDLRAILDSTVDLGGRIQKVGEYPVNGGGFADVWRGLLWGGEDRDNVADAKEVALKILRLVILPDAKVLKRIKHEVKIWSRLNHENVQPLFGLSTHYGLRSICMVSPWHENGTAVEYLNNRYSEDIKGDAMVLRTVIGIVRGLSHLHSQLPPVVHGDLKGSNVLIDKHGTALLTDFGLSNIADEIDSGGTTTSYRQGGSTRWMAPERLDPESYNRTYSESHTLSSDIFALGVTIYEMLSGLAPYANLHDAAVIFAITQGRRPAPAPWRASPDTSNVVVPLMERCYGAQPDDRPSAQEVLTALPLNWLVQVSEEVLRSLSDMEITRQEMLYKLIQEEEQFANDLAMLRSLFVEPLRAAPSTVIPEDELEGFITDVFGNFLALKEVSDQLLNILRATQRENSLIIRNVGAIFFNLSEDFKSVYPAYVGHLPAAQMRLTRDMGRNPDLMFFFELCARSPDARGKELKNFLVLPSEHFNKYSRKLQDIAEKTTYDAVSDESILFDALKAIRNIAMLGNLMRFQCAVELTPATEWHNLLPEGMELSNIPRQEIKRQSTIFELIKGEIEYVKDLETIDNLFWRALNMDNVIPKERLDTFLWHAFYNYKDLHHHHRRLLDMLLDIQRKEHPFIQSIVNPIFDAALTWREAYLLYISHYPIAAYIIEEETENNPAFKTFVEQCKKHPDARRHDMKSLINRPIPRLLRYDLLLRNLIDFTPTDHADREMFPRVLDLVVDLGKAAELGVTSARNKVQLFLYSKQLVWKEGVNIIDLQLEHSTRSLLHSGRLLRQSNKIFKWNQWSECFVFIFDHYFVITKAVESEGSIKYTIQEPAIPIELLVVTNSDHPPQQRSVGFLRRGRRKAAPSLDERSGRVGQEAEDELMTTLVYPFSIGYTDNKQLGGVYTLFTDTAEARQEWIAHLHEALALKSPNSRITLLD